MKGLNYAIATALYDAVEGDDRGVARSGEDIIDCLDGYVPDGLEAFINGHKSLPFIKAWFDGKGKELAKALELDFDNMDQAYYDLVGRESWYQDVIYAATGACHVTEFWEIHHTHPAYFAVEPIKFSNGYPEVEIHNMGYDLLLHCGIDVSAEDSGDLTQFDDIELD